MRPQDKYNKEKMTIVSARFKNEFAEEFKQACKALGVSQADVIRDAMNQTIEKANALNELDMFSIEKMNQDDTYFNQFIQELKDYDDFGKFKGYFGRPSDVEDRICELNTSCEIYTEVNGSYECANNDKEIHDEFGSDDNRKIKGYIAIEVGYGKHVKMYGEYFCEDWDDDEEVYQNCSFGNYYGIDLD